MSVLLHAEAELQLHGLAAGEREDDGGAVAALFQTGRRADGPDLAGRAGLDGAAGLAVEREGAVLIALDGDALSLRLETVNTSSEPFLLTEGFHPYFLVGDRDKVVVKGVDGRLFCDARSSRVFAAAWKGDLAVTDAFDHVFASPGGEYSLVDASRGHTIKMSAQGNRRLVVWNPGDARSADAVPAPGALGNGDWRRFVCVEPATLWRDQGFTLKPGERHSLSARISVAED